MIFVDSSHWIPEFLPRDRRHAKAAERSRAVESRPLVTSDLVLAETWTFLRRRSGHHLAFRWLDGVAAAMSIGIQRIGEDLQDEAWAWLRVHDERPYSFVDATSFALMRKLRVTEALAFDGDFAAAGFTELEP